MLHIIDTDGDDRFVRLELATGGCIESSKKEGEEELYCLVVGLAKDGYTDTVTIDFVGDDQYEKVVDALRGA